jgi:hypothetical protein
VIVGLALGSRAVVAARAVCGYSRVVVARAREGCGALMASLASSGRCGVIIGLALGGCTVVAARAVCSYSRVVIARA